MTHGAGTIRDLLDRHGVQPSRALGQNFVHDPNTVRRIAALAGAAPGGLVVEVGPGLGSLTLALAETGAEVVAVEYDRHLLPVLAEVTDGVDPPVTIVHGDATTIDWDTVLAGRPARLVANLPYNVGTTILLRLLETAPTVRGGVVLVQKEVADRLVAVPGTKAFGIPSVKASWWVSSTPAGKVSAAVFHPRPRVDSALVTFERRDPPGDEQLRTRVFALVDAGFGQRRKMLRRSLSGHVEPTAFEAAGIASTARAEELTLADWCALASS